MADRTLVDDETGDYEDLKTEAIDPSDIIDDEDDARNGLPRFLQWKRRKRGKDDEYLEATGLDGKVYTIVNDDPPVAAKQGKVHIVVP